MKKGELIQQLINEANQDYPDFQEIMHTLQNLKVTATGKDRDIVTQAINEVLNKAFALKEHNTKSNNPNNDNHAYKVTFELLHLIIEKHDYALFSKHWVNYFAQKYSPRYDPKAKWGSPNLIDELHLKHSPIIKALNNDWLDITELLLPMFNQMCRESRGNHIPAFIEKEYLKGIQWYYSNFTTKQLAPSYYNKGKVLMDAINKGNWDIFLEIINHEEYKGVSHSAFFPNQGYPSAWAMRANRMDMLSYMVENNQRLHVLYEQIENCDIHPLYEAADLEDKQKCDRFFPYLLEHYLPILPVQKEYHSNGKDKDLILVEKTGINNGIVMCAAIKLIEHDNLPMLKYLIEEKGYDFHGDDELLLAYACRAENEHIMQYLYDLGADIHAGNNKAYWWALDYSLKGIQFLEQHGLDTSQMIGETLATIITRDVSDEMFDYFLYRATVDELHQALEKVRKKELENSSYLNAGRVLKNKAKVRHYLMNQNLSVLPEDISVSDKNEEVNKI